MTADRLLGPDRWVGCVVGAETGIVRVLTDRGELRASYGARLLALVARDRSEEPQVGDWVRLRSWSDDRVTVEGRMAGTSGPAAAAPATTREQEPDLASVVWLSSRR